MDEEEKKPEKEKTGGEQEKPAISPEEVPRELQKEPEQVVGTQKFIPKKAEAGEIKPGKWEKVKRFIVECKRVLRVTKKPDAMEFKTIVKISGIGIVIIGIIGFLIHFAKELMF